MLQQPLIPVVLGQQFGRLTVLGKERAPDGALAWRCSCSCGGEKVVRHRHLVRGATRSCGCLEQESRHTTPITHGMSGTRVYRLWSDMRSRCAVLSGRNYENYGGRGIAICARWRRFENFYADMGEPPEGTSIDRIDNDKGYSPENCRWATVFEQANNRRSNIVISYNGRSQTVTQWSREFGVPYCRLRSRLALGWDIERALTAPSQERRRA